MKLPRASIKRVVTTFRTADLGDPRRNRRLKQTVGRLARRPQATLPEAMRDEAMLEGAYRLFNNPRVSLRDLIDAQADETARRARTEGAAIAIHDTTTCKFGHADPDVVGYLNTGKAGFFAHYTLIVNDERRPLGITHVEAISRSRPPRKRTARKGKTHKKSGSETIRDPNRESKRWFRGISETAKRLEDRENVIHVADRESDSYELMANCIQAGHRFVFRVRVGDRRARSENTRARTVRTIAKRAEAVLTREVYLSTRRKNAALKGASANPPRRARMTTLTISATQVEIPRPRHHVKDLPETLTINVVRVFEAHPPAGEKGVEWLLFTTEAVDTETQVARIVDTYCARWLIEECNKALKTGCMYEERQFESKEALLTLLGISLPIACEILSLRSRTREQPSRPATDVLTALQLRILRKLAYRRLPKHPTAADALRAVAALGGHQRSNGDPGWLVLQRGMRELLACEVGWRLRDAAEARNL